MSDERTQNLPGEVWDDVPSILRLIYARLVNIENRLISLGDKLDQLDKLEDAIRDLKPVNLLR